MFTPPLLNDRVPSDRIVERTDQDIGAAAAARLASRRRGRSRDIPAFHAEGTDRSLESNTHDIEPTESKTSCDMARSRVGVTEDALSVVVPPKSCNQARDEWSNSSGKRDVDVSVSYCGLTATS